MTGIKLPPGADEPDYGALLGGDDITLVGRVSGALREEIVSGELAADSRLRIEALAQRFGVSTIPVREALRGLATEGLVTPEVNRGFRVRSAGPRDLEETYSLRVLLDPLAVRLAVPRMTEQHLEAVAASLEEMRTAADHDTQKYWRNHMDFHFGIYRHCGQSWLLRFVHSLYSNSDRYRVSRDPPLARYADHLEVLEACRAGESLAAAKHMQAHIKSSYMLRAPAVVPGGTGPSCERWATLDWSSSMGDG